MYGCSVEAKHSFHTSYLSRNLIRFATNLELKFYIFPFLNVIFYVSSVSLFCVILLLKLMKRCDALNERIYVKY